MQSVMAALQGPIAIRASSRRTAGATARSTVRSSFVGTAMPSISMHRTSGTASRMVTKAAVDPQVAVAALQQDLAFVAMIAAEGFYTQSITEEGTGGRPEVTAFGPLCAGLALASALLATRNDFIAPAGAVLGLAASVACGLSFVERFKATPSNPVEWPGPKSWPGAGAFIAGLAFLTNLSCLTHLFV